MNPTVIIFITWLMIIKVVLRQKAVAISTLTTNRHVIFFHYGVHATNSHNWGKLSIYNVAQEVKAAENTMIAGMSPMLSNSLQFSSNLAR